jgi:hypothetical protein
MDRFIRETHDKNPIKTIVDEKEEKFEEPAPPENKEGQVCRACAIPNGIILRLHEKRAEMEQGPMGPREITMWREVDIGNRLFIPGPNANFGVGGDRNAQGRSFALSFQSKAFVTQWLEQNADSTLVSSGALLFSQKPGVMGEEQVSDEAKEKF